MKIISLGSSCDIANNLKRIGINNPSLFFDFVWNEYDGLKNVNNIIINNFLHFNNINNYDKTINHPILNWKPFDINKDYPTFVFMHHDTTQQNIIDSLNRKIERTQNVLSSNEMKIFIYYRHYNWDFNMCSDLNVIINESMDFCKIYKDKYNDNFYLLSLITYDSQTDIKIIHQDILLLKKNENKYLKFDFVYRRNDENEELNKIAINSWDNIFHKYGILDP